MFIIARKAKSQWIEFSLPDTVPTLLSDFYVNKIPRACRNVPAALFTHHRQTDRLAEFLTVKYVARTQHLAGEPWSECARAPCAVVTGAGLRKKKKKRISMRGTNFDTTEWKWLTLQFQFSTRQTAGRRDRELEYDIKPDVY